VQWIDHTADVFVVSTAGNLLVPIGHWISKAVLHRYYKRSLGPGHFLENWNQKALRRQTKLSGMQVYKLYMPCFSECAQEIRFQVSMRFIPWRRASVTSRKLLPLDIVYHANLGELNVSGLVFFEEFVEHGFFPFFCDFFSCSAAMRIWITAPIP
jgi:hypothetical protein